MIISLIQLFLHTNYWFNQLKLNLNLSIIQITYTARTNRLKTSFCKLHRFHHQLPSPKPPNATLTFSGPSSWNLKALFCFADKKEAGKTTSTSRPDRHHEYSDMLSESNTNNNLTLYISLRNKMILQGKKWKQKETDSDTTEPV